MLKCLIKKQINKVIGSKHRIMKTALFFSKRTTNNEQFHIIESL